MYRVVIVYASAQQPVERLVRELETCFDRERFKVEAIAAGRAAMPDLTGSQLFVLASQPEGQQPIHPDFEELLRALRGVTLAGRVGAACTVDGQQSLAAFRRALQDCELDLREHCFRAFPGGSGDSAQLCEWALALTTQLEGQLHGT